MTAHFPFLVQSFIVDFWVMQTATSASYLKSRYLVRFHWCYIIDLYVPCELSQVLHIWILTVSVFTCVLYVTSVQRYFVSVHLWYGPPCTVWDFTGVSYNWLLGIVRVFTRVLYLISTYCVSFHISILIFFTFSWWKCLYNHCVILLEH